MFQWKPIEYSQIQFYFQCKDVLANMEPKGKCYIYKFIVTG